MFKTVRVYKSTVKAIENSEFKCFSVNQVFMIVINSFNSQSNIFWERICSKYTEEKKESVIVKLEESIIKRLDKVVDFITRKYMRVDRMFVMEQLFYQYINPETEIIMSLNVKGYKAGTDDLKDRLIRITERVNEIMPDMIFLQEMKLGEGKEILDVFVNGLKGRYSYILPTGLDPEYDHGICICLVMIRTDLIEKCNILNMKVDKREWRHRYNMFEIKGRVYVNIWIQQTFSTGTDNTKAIADSMWESLLSEVAYYANNDGEFYVIGDFNSCADTYEENLKSVAQKLVDTKCNADINKPTSSANILDYAFANRYTVQHSLVETRIYKPSVREDLLSDHDALVMTVKRCIRYK